MCALQILLTLDPSLGRVDYRLLSDQTLMEMLFCGFDDESNKEFQDNDGMYLEVCGWPGVKCDDDQRVIEIYIDSKNLSGSLELFYIPPKVKRLNISSWCRSQLAGSVDLAHLPNGIESLDLNYNQLTGEINLTQLPDEMELLYLNNNQLAGQVDLTHLANGIKRLFLNDNQLTGEIDLTHLPYGILFLSLENNQLMGQIDLTHLPEAMTYLYLQNNQLSGSLVIKKLPLWVNVIDVRGNHFNAIAVFDSKTRAHIDLKGSGVTSVVDENGREQDVKLFVK